MLAFSGVLQGTPVFYIDNTDTDERGKRLFASDVENTGRPVRIIDPDSGKTLAEGYMVTDEQETSWPASLLLLLRFKLGVGLHVEEKIVDDSVGINQWEEIW